MNNQLRAYIEEIFADAPPTKKAVEVKEEILQNLIDKYNDLLEEGKTSEAAYNIAIANIGDMSKLIEELKEDYTMQQDPSYMRELEQCKKRSAAITSIAVALYILSVIPIMIFNDNIIGIILMFIIVAVATAMLIYNNMTKLSSPKADDSLAEEFKEFQVHNSNRNRTIKAVNSTIWALTTALYLLLSFWTGTWHITWVLFIMAWAAENFVKAVIDMRD